MEWICITEGPEPLPSHHGVYWGALWKMRDPCTKGKAEWVVLLVGGKYYASPNSVEYLGEDKVTDIGPFDTLEEAQEIAYTTSMLTCRPEDFL